MTGETAEAELDASFRARVAAMAGGSAAVAPDLERWLTLFDAMAASRHLDLQARRLRAAGRGFYTISSAGHEPNAAVALALRPDDPALLHYRSGGFYLARSMQAFGRDAGLRRGVRDVLLGLVGAADEPIAGGRHKVFGRRELSVIPQTSTIASHLPRAMGLALSLARAYKLGVECPSPRDAVVVASFGDASLNHSTALGAINAACHAAYQGLPVPLLLVCEDNGWGISVPTPAGWIEATYAHHPHLRYLCADGTDPRRCLAAAAEAADTARRTRRPVMLHLRLVRYLGHAGSDAEIAYRTPTEIAADLERDPLVGLARVLIGEAGLDAADVLDRYDTLGTLVAETAAEVAQHRGLASRAEVMAPLAPATPDQVAKQVAATVAGADRRAAAFGGRLPETRGRLTLAESLNAALADALAADRSVIVFGEDVGRKGGVYGITGGLARRFGAGRVFDTLLDEQSILGLGLGAGLAGLLPVPEIQYLAYLHNAEDQLRGEAASMQFFATGQYRNPMVVRIAGLAYQKGFGGHFHNDNAVTVLRDIPGLIIACPSRGDDAAAMLRTCLAAAHVDGAVSVFVEPIALYHTRDLHHPGDGGWTAEYAAPAAWADAHVPVGAARTYLDGTELTIVTFGNGVPMSLRVARRLPGIRVVDLRWLAPLPVDDIRREARASGRVLIVDETRRSGGVSEAVIAALVDGGFDGSVSRVAAADSFVPLGDAADLVLVSEPEIEAAARDLLRRPAGR